MKKYLALSIITAASLYGMSSITIAETTPSNLMMSNILEKVRTAGFTICKEIDHEHDRFEADAINSQGKPLKLIINPKTGEIIPKKGSISNFSMMDVVRIVEKEGYHDISEIKFKKDRFKIEALNRDNQKVKLKVNSVTGAIKVDRDWF